MVFDGGQMRLAQLVPDARGHIPADHTVVQHGNAGAPNHGVQLVANHEVSQRTPQRHDDTPMAMVWMHTATPEFHHPGAQTAQACQIKLGVAIGAAYPLSLRWSQDAVGSNHRLAGFVKHQQVLAKVIKQINVMPRDGGGQPGPHFQSEDFKTQLLSLPHLIKVTGPPDLNPRRRRLCDTPCGTTGSRGRNGATGGSI